MTNILFTSNNKAHFVNSQISSASESFDNTRVPYAIMITGTSEISSPEFTPTTGTVTWVHWRHYYDTYETQRIANMIKGYDTNGNILFAADHTWQEGLGLVEVTLYTDPGTSTTISTFPANASLINSIDVRYENNGTNETKVGLYINGGLAAEITEASSVISAARPPFI